MAIQFIVVALQKECTLGFEDVFVRANSYGYRLLSMVIVEKYRSVRDGSLIRYTYYVRNDIEFRITDFTSGTCKIRCDPINKNATTVSIID